MIKRLLIVAEGQRPKSSHGLPEVDSASAVEKSLEHSLSLCSFFSEKSEEGRRMLHIRFDASEL